MLTLLDLQLLRLITNHTPVKNILKSGYYSTTTYSKINKYKKFKIIKKVKNKPVTYATTFKGAILLSALEEYKELL